MLRLRLELPRPLCFFITCRRQLYFFCHLFGPCSYSTTTNMYIAVNISYLDILYIFSCNKYKRGVRAIFLYIIHLDMWNSFFVAVPQLSDYSFPPGPPFPCSDWAPLVPACIHRYVHAVSGSSTPCSSVRLHVTPHNSNIQTSRLGLIKLTPFQVKEFFSGSADQVCYFWYSVWRVITLLKKTRFSSLS
jgi:hypothetical protein